MQDAFSDMKPVGITVQQVNGKWFVSPVGTYADIVLTVMAALDKNELTDIIDGVRKVAESFTTRRHPRHREDVDLEARTGEIDRR